jgi:hypothetical protein
MFVVERKHPRSPFVAALVLFAAIACTSCGESTDIIGALPPPPPPPTPVQGTVQIDPAARFQTMRGWEVHTETQNNESPGDPTAFDAFKDELFDRAVNEAGINRLRLEVRSGAENVLDYWAQFQAGAISTDEWRATRYATVNDNGDPNSMNPSGFLFSELDDNVTRIVLPIKQRIEANGETLYVTLTYVAFTQSITTGAYHHTTPAEYAEFILAAFQHLQATYGLIPDALEIILEPDVAGAWNSTLTGQVIVPVTDRLSANGFNPKIIAPSTTSMASAPTYFNSWAATARARVQTVAYHRYTGVTTGNLQTIAALGKETAMLEWWNSSNGYEVLHQDLKVGNNSAWEQGVLASEEGPMSLYHVDVSNPAQPVVSINEKTKFTRQYYKHVRRGAVRIGATSSNGALDPLAFVNINGRHVVVVKASGAATFTVGGLPAGTYGLSYATSDEWGVDQPDQTIDAGQTVSASIPGSGVITVYAR